MNIQEALEICASDACYGVEDLVDAGQTLAAAYRELTTLRPMSEAPMGESIIVVDLDNDFRLGNRWPNGIATDMAVSPLDSFKGWLPIPEVKG